jgi:uncharacterized protein YkwD
VSETRPRRATIKVSLAAFAAGAVIAGTATILNSPNQASGLDVPLVAGYNGAKNQARQTGEASQTADATALSGSASAGGPTSGSTTSSSATSSTPSSTKPTSSSSQTSEQPAPPPPPSPQTSPKAPGAPNTGEAAKVVQLVNQFRAGMCDALTVDGRLTNAAQGHSTDMSQRKYFEHTTPEGVTFAQRIKTAGYPSPGAENIAQGQRSAEQVMQSWMQSPGHRTNIMNCDYTTIGVAVDTNGWYWTQDFGF